MQILSKAKLFWSANLSRINKVGSKSCYKAKFNSHFYRFERTQWNITAFLNLIKMFHRRRWTCSWPTMETPTSTCHIKGTSNYCSHIATPGSCSSCPAKLSGYSSGWNLNPMQLWLKIDSTNLWTIWNIYFEEIYR